MMGRPTTRSMTKAIKTYQPQEEEEDSRSPNNDDNGGVRINDKKQKHKTVILNVEESAHSPPSPPLLNLRRVADRYLSEAEEYVDKAECFEKEAHRSMGEADCYSKRGENFVEEALNDPGPGAIKLYEAARDTYNRARRCLEESVRCNDAATRNYRTARDYYEAYGRCCPSCPSSSLTNPSTESD